jgi:hypothetical protein
MGGWIFCYKREQNKNIYSQIWNIFMFNHFCQLSGYITWKGKKLRWLWMVKRKGCAMKTGPISRYIPTVPGTRITKIRNSSPRKFPQAVAILDFMGDISVSSLDYFSDCHILGSSQPLQANAEVIPLPSKRFPIHYSVSSSHSTMQL